MVGNLKKPLVLVGVPSLGDWKARFGVSLATMFAASVAQGDMDVALCSVVGSILPNQRLDIVKQAKQVGASHLLYVDADMEFPANLLSKWLAYGKPVIAANCMIKQIPSQSTARQWDGEKWQPVYTSKEAEGLEQVNRVGTGIMLIEMSIFDHIEQPYFEMRWKPDMDGYQGEDWAFCEKLAHAEIPIFVDHTISKDVCHIGEFRYSHRHVKPEWILPSEVK